MEDRRVRKTKAALKSGFARLLLQKNINEITVSELTELVDIHRGTFYLHYRDIYDLQEKIQEEIVEDIEEIIRLNHQNILGANPFPFMLALMNYLQKNHTIGLAFLSQNGDMKFIDRIVKLTRERCLYQWMEKHVSEGDTYYRYFCEYTVSGCISIVRYWLNNGTVETPEEMAGIMKNLSQSGMGFLVKNGAAGAM